MDLDAIKKVLADSAPEVDPNTTFAEFKVDKGAVSPEEFLDYLRDSDLISNDTFCELHAQSDIEVTGFGQIHTNYGEEIQGLDADLDDTNAQATKQQTNMTLEPAPADWDITQKTDLSLDSARYDLIGIVGAGAMGVVHIARDNDLRRKVAFKRMLPEAAQSLAARRFLSEVQITAQLDHPNIVPVYSLETAPDGTPAYAMKLVQGRNLQQLHTTARKQLDGDGRADRDHRLATRLEHFLKVCDAVAYAHSKGVVHRDLKPANIMIGKYHEVYVMDWGIARLVRSESKLTAQIQTSNEAQLGTRIGAVIGTPAYMSPEQAEGAVPLIGPHSDVFALGLILFETATLKQAYTGTTATDVLARARLADKNEPSAYHASEQISVDIVAIIDRATARKTGSRYRTVDEMANDVRRALAGEPTHARPDNLPRKVLRWLRRNTWVFAVVVVATVFVTGLAVVNQAASNRTALAVTRAETAEKERNISEFRSQTAAHGQRMDNHLQRYEGMLERISGAGTQALTLGISQDFDGQLWTTPTFRETTTAAPGMQFSHHYNRPINPDWPVTHIPTSTSEDVWRADFARIVGMRGLLRDVYMHRPDGSEPPVDAAAQRELITGKQVVMEWSYITVEKSGIIMMFPGAAGWDDNYDPRERPWYKQALERRGKVWGKPYADLMGQGRLISCVEALYDGDGELLGVAGIDLEFNYISENYMRMEEAGFVSAYLLDQDGRVMVSTTLEDDPFVVPATEEDDAGLDYGLFEVEAVVAAAGDAEPGFLLREVEGGAEQLLTWSPLNSIGWTYVVVADMTEL